MAAQPTIASVSKAITAKQLAATATITGVNKAYDGLTAATGSSVSGSTTGALNGDVVALDTSGVALNFNSAHVASATTIAASGNAAMGAVTAGGVGTKDGTAGNAVAGAASDYALAAQPTIASVSKAITAASITSVTGITAENKVYDGNTSATLNTSTAGFTGKFGSDVLNVSAATGAFIDAAVGIKKQVNITGIALGGANASDYVLTSTTASATADITAGTTTPTPVTPVNVTPEKVKEAAVAAYVISPVSTQVNSVASTPSSEGPKTIYEATSRVFTSGGTVSNVVPRIVAVKGSGIALPANTPAFRDDENVNKENN